MMGFFGRKDNDGESGDDAIDRQEMEWEHFKQLRRDERAARSFHLYHEVPHLEAYEEGGDRKDRRTASGPACPTASTPKRGRRW
ncbi:hypothetical protein [Actinacidiphila sp. ITFR-21]|uniref:hypothetical protein n=1 Tax=Actinacidiphila sp. ITFR-21 TaxID=3075199 RepID=UPI0028896518|nr:hypothetical protein [Streptomyces sp. ITFR-21]WNI18276.1 hypothetical protein RLT57_23875 [Streptomyces sp. ITFR-21]